VTRDKLRCKPVGDEGVDNIAATISVKS